MTMIKNKEETMIIIETKMIMIENYFHVLIRLSRDVRPHLSSQIWFIQYAISLNHLNDK